jgi:hypothetical protein
MERGCSSESTTRGAPIACLFPYQAINHAAGFLTVLPLTPTPPLSLFHQATAATADTTAPAVATTSTAVAAGMSLTQVIGILVGGAMLLIGLGLVAYIFYLNKKMEQDAKARYHDEEEGHHHHHHAKKANRGAAAPPGAALSPHRRASFDKSAAIREHAAFNAELRGPVQDDAASKSPQKFPGMSPLPASVKPATPIPQSLPQPHSQAQQLQLQSPPKPTPSAFPGIALHTPPRSAPAAPQQQLQQPQAAQAPAPATTTPPNKKKFVELSDVFGED